MKNINAKILARTLWSMAQDKGQGPDSALPLFIAFLERNNLTHFLPSIMRQYAYLEEQASAPFTGSALIAADTQADRAHLDSVRKKLGIPQEVALALTIEPSILGGCVVTWNNCKYDFSIKRQIERLKHSLSA